MTDPVKVPSDDALREIEARAKKYKQLAKRAATPADEEVIRWLVKQIDSLCATVRALRSEKEHWESPTDEGTCRFCGNLRDIPHGHIRKCYCIPTIKRYVEEVTELLQQLRLEQSTSAEFKRLSEDLVARLQSENTALREQLAQLTIELERESREMQKWNNRANQLAIEGQELRQQLAQVTQRARHIENCKDCQSCWEGSQP